MISDHVAHLPECPESRRACLNYAGGCCRALTDTFFIKQKKKPCPFYKTKAMVTVQLKEASEWRKQNRL